MIKKNISIICACTKNSRTIGVKNALPWTLQEDLAHFKKITMGHPVIMGRKTFLSIGKSLPGRLNIIISHDSQLIEKNNDTTVYVDSFDSAINIGILAGGGECFIIGGETIFKQSMEIANRIFLTEIDAEYDGDKHFPSIDLSKWKLTQKEDHPESNPPFSFLTYEKK